MRPKAECLLGAMGRAPTSCSSSRSTSRTRSPRASRRGHEVCAARGMRLPLPAMLRPGRPSSVPRSPAASGPHRLGDVLSPLWHATWVDDGDQACAAAKEAAAAV